MNNLDKVNRNLFEDTKFTKESESYLINWFEKQKGGGNLPEELNKLSTKNKFKYTYSLKNTKKSFMKNFTDIDMIKAIEDGLTLGEIHLLNRLKLFINYDNIVNVSKLKKEFGYSSNSFSKMSRKLKDKGLLKKYEGFYYLNPVCGIKAETISEDLMIIFKDNIKQFNTELISKRTYE